MRPSKRQRSKPHSPSAQGPACPSCGAVVLPEASFCQACGVSLTERSGAGRWLSGKVVAVVAGIVGLSAAVVLGVVIVSEEDRAPSDSFTPPPPAFQQPATLPSGDPPDLSQLTPRQMADRLFNRVMIASERGNRSEALDFVPMAVQAYSNLPALDRDAHYHLSLIHNVAGDRAEVEQHLAALRDGAPNHLLALVLEHRLARKAGDQASAGRIRAAFDAAYDAEIAIGRPEYREHRNVIEGFRAAAASPTADATGVEPPAAREGAALFAANCAMCHGPGALGSDKGPPLVHKTYEPSHHDDESFFRAVRQGVSAHHWSFGDMPAVPGVTEGETEKIIAYVRDLQRLAGIE